MDTFQSPQASTSTPPFFFEGRVEEKRTKSASCNAKYVGTVLNFKNRSMIFILISDIRSS